MKFQISVIAFLSFLHTISSVGSLEVIQEHNLLVEFDNQRSDYGIFVEDLSSYPDWISNGTYHYHNDIGKKVSFAYYGQKNVPFFKPLMRVRIGWGPQAFLIGFGVPFNNDTDEYSFGLRWSDDTETSNALTFDCREDCDRCFKPAIAHTQCTMRREKSTIATLISDPRETGCSAFRWKLTVVVAN